MSDKILSGAALAAAGVAAAGLLSARSAQAATPTTHVTLYFTTPPPGTVANDPNTVLIPNTSTNYPQGIQGTKDVQILNFALFVETLEAARYVQSIARLGSGGTDDFGNPITGLGLGNGDTGSHLDVLLVNGFAQTEMQQRDILATTLYGSPGANPFLSTPTSQYRYDFGINSLQRSDVVANLTVAETIGVAAYLGGSGLLAIQSPFLAPAASFLGVEARHAASLAYAVNMLAGSQVLHTAPLTTDIPNSFKITGGDMPLTADQILYAKGNVAPGLLPAALAGVTPAITGPTGFAYRPS